MDLRQLDEKRIFIKDVFKGKGKKAVVAGWAKNSRALGKIKFLVLKDATGEIQITASEGKTEKKILEQMGKISRESVIVVEGEVKESKQAPGGKEIFPEKITVLNKAEDLPIDISENSKTELPKRLDFRFLDFHRKKTQAIFKIQNEISNAFREFFYNKEYLEMQPPCIISAASEGGTELFPVQYFEKKAYLAQSPQLYKQMLACSAERVFMITPVWRAEKHNIKSKNKLTSCIRRP